VRSASYRSGGAGEEHDVVEELRAAHDGKQDSVDLVGEVVVDPMGIDRDRVAAAHERATQLDRHPTLTVAPHDVLGDDADVHARATEVIPTHTEFIGL
jgi:hypothetical protein